MYKCALRKSVEKLFHKLAKKSPARLSGVYKKIEEIRERPHHYKNLRRPLSHLKRVHIDKSFVIVFSIDERRKLVIIEDYEHHNKIYKK